MPVLPYQSELVPTGETDPRIGLLKVGINVDSLTIATIANTSPAGVPNTSIPIRVSGTRKFGITARHVIISRLETIGAGTIRVYRRIPVFDPVVFTEYLGSLSPAISYESQTDWVLVGAKNEAYRLYFNTTAG
jgi:hypothetical protein